MARINSNYDKLAAGYLFPEIARRTNAFLEANSGTQVLRLGIGDTTEPIVSAVLDGLHQGVKNLGNADILRHGPSEGVFPFVRGSQICMANMGKARSIRVFVSDGAKSTLNIQGIFLKTV